MIYGRDSLADTLSNEDQRPRTRSTAISKSVQFSGGN